MQENDGLRLKQVNPLKITALPIYGRGGNDGKEFLMKKKNLMRDCNINDILLT